MKKEEIISIPTIKRWHPNFRYEVEKKVDAPLENFKSTTPSVTDKEAYRVTLASLRGQLAQGSGKIDVGSYSIKAGEEYNPVRDFSFLNRPDLTIVELDERINLMTTYQQKYDGELKAEMDRQLTLAKERRNELVKSENNKKSKEDNE